MNEFVARNGLIALDSSSISGPFVVTGSVYASNGISTGGNMSAGPNLTLNGTGTLVLSAGGLDSQLTQTGINSLILTNANGTYIFKKTAQADFFVISAHSGYSYTTGNFGIGVTIPTARLDVRGNTFLSGSITGSDMLIRGSGATSATNALLIQNSGSSPLLYVRNDGYTEVLNNFKVGGGVTFFGAAQLYISNNGGYVTNSNGAVLRYETSFNSGVSSPFAFTYNLFGAENGTATDITNSNFGGIFAPTSGTKTFNLITIAPLINQTGGANGVTRGLYINPTLTAAADWRSIEWSNNAATAPSASWGLYGVGTAPNYLAGNLGIGTTSPGARLHISSSTVNDALLITTPNNNSSLYPFFLGGATLTSDVYLRANASNIEFFRQGNPSTIRTVGSSNNLVLQSATNLIFNTNGANEYARIDSNGNLGIRTTSPSFRLDLNGSFRSSGSITATSGSDYFDISHDITQPAQTGSQIYEVNITPTLRYTAPNQTQTALRVSATFSGSTVLSSSQANIIADFGSTSAGSQFLVNDVTSGSIYMVNDVSGLPIIEANSNWDVMIYDYPNVVLRKTGSTIEISGSLRLNGSFLDTAWTPYTPVWTAASTNPVIGNGTIEGYYKVVGKTCFVRGNIAMGSTTTFGSGEWYVSMPFTASNADAILMSANLLDNSTAWYNATMNGARSGFNNRAPIQYQNTGGTASDINATQPFTWTTSDRFIWNGSYELA
jgi:hypothetical protein